MSEYTISIPHQPSMNDMKYETLVTDPDSNATYTIEVRAETEESQPLNVQTGKWAKYKQCYRHEWLQDPNLRDWLAPDPSDETRAHCKACKKSLNAHKKDLYTHRNSKVHGNQLANYIASEDFHDHDSITSGTEVSFVGDGSISNLSSGNLTVIAQESGIVGDDIKPFVRKKRAYRKRKAVTMASCSSPIKTTVSQVTLEQTQSLQAVEALLGMDLANTLRGLGDIEIHIPMDDLTSPSKKKLRVSCELDEMEGSSTEVKLSTSDCPITSVTVYKDRAEVCRCVDAVVKLGTNEIKIDGFVDVDEESIRVEGKGQATIAEVTFQTRFGADEELPLTEKEKALTDTLKLLKEGQRSLDSAAQIKLLDRQWNVLDQFAASAAKSGSVEGQMGTLQLDENYFAGMKDFMSQYREMGRQLDSEKLEVKKKADELEEKIRTVEKNLAELKVKGDRSQLPRECVVVLESMDDEAPVQLKLSYVVYRASWVPSYDLRMNTDTGLLMMTYFGLISQHSGEDWTNVKLHLSTAEPSVGGSIPSVPHTQVSIFKERTYASKRSYGAFGSKSPKRKGKSTRSDYDTVLSLAAADFDEMPPLPLMANTSVEIQETTVSASYEIARLTSIPSDNSQHKVTVGLVELTPTLTYVTIPKVVPHAFIQAKVTNTSQFTLLPGRTNIFLDNSFVAKAAINAVAPQEEFECSLGVDPGVRVTYKPLVKVNSTYGIISKAKVVTHEQGIEVKNVHSYPIQISVKDTLPRSTDDKVKVSLQTPIIDPRHPGKSEATLVQGDTLQWEVSVAALGKKDLMLKYNIEHPAGEALDYVDV